MKKNNIDWHEIRVGILLLIWASIMISIPFILF